MMTVSLASDSILPPPRPSPRIRADVEWSLLGEDSNGRWVARDPVSMEYFYFNRLEKRLTELLDGRSNPAEILRKLQVQFPAAELSVSWLQRMLARLKSANLLLTDDDASGYVQRKRLQERKNLAARFLSPLAIRISLCDPTPLLRYLDGVGRWLFSRAALFTAFAAGLIVGWLVLLKLLDSFSISQSLVELAHGERLFWLIVCYAAVKSMHELGHALACRHVGAECHDVGILFLCFTPCLYCDVSDSWRIPSRLRRAAVSAAGLYVEMNLAVLAGFIWLASQPGLLNSLAANIMVVCSLSTILVNANPLLKYDGYYVLSDLSGVPNLMQHSQLALREWIVAKISGRKMSSEHWDASPQWLALFAFASFIYRAILVFTIAWVLHFLSHQWGLKWLAQFVVWALAIGFLLPLVRSISSVVQELVLLRTGSTPRLIFVGVVLATAIWMLFFVPLPTYVRSRGVCRYAKLEPLFVPRSAIVRQAVRSGSRITSGQLLARLEQFDDQIEQLEMRADIEGLAERVKDLSTRSVDDKLAAELLPTASQSLIEMRSQAAALERDLASLDILSPDNGMLIAGNWRQPRVLASYPQEKEVREPELAEHLGCAVERGELIGWLAKTEFGFRVETLVLESDADLLQVGAPVRCRWDSAPSEVVVGRVQSISAEPTLYTPLELVGDGEFVSKQGHDGTTVPQQSSYLVRVELEGIPSSISHGSLVTTRIEVSSRTVWQSLIRSMRQTFRVSSMIDRVRP